jgi:hypothetical protein
MVIKCADHARPVSWCHPAPSWNAWLAHQLLGRTDSLMQHSSAALVVAIGIYSLGLPSSVDGARAPTNTQLFARSGKSGKPWSVHQTHADGQLATTFSLSDFSFTSANGLST